MTAPAIPALGTNPSQRKALPVTTLTIPAGTLARIATVCLPHTDKDDLLPVFCCVRLFERDGHLYGEATDRYTVGACRTDAVAPEGLDVMIHRDDLRAVLAAFKAQRRSTVVLRLEVSEETLRFSLAEGLLANGVDLTLAVERREGAFPAVSWLYVKPASAAPVASAPYLDTKFLRRLPDGPAQVRVTEGGAEPVAFYGEDWAAALMALRPQADLSASWVATPDESTATDAELAAEVLA